MNTVKVKPAKNGTFTIYRLSTPIVTGLKKEQANRLAMTIVKNRLGIDVQHR